jgi:hypothetical protein
VLIDYFQSASLDALGQLSSPDDMLLVLMSKLAKTDPVDSMKFQKATIGLREYLFTRRSDDLTS